MCEPVFMSMHGEVSDLDFGRQPLSAGVSLGSASSRWNIGRPRIAGRQDSTEVVERVRHLRSGGRGTRQLTGGVEVVVERIHDRASRHPFFLRPTMQIVVRKIRHTSVAIRATRHVSCRIVAE